MLLSISSCPALIEPAKLVFFCFNPLSSRKGKWWLASLPWNIWHKRKANKLTAIMVHPKYRLSIYFVKSMLNIFSNFSLYILISLMTCAKLSWEPIVKRSAVTTDDKQKIERLKWFQWVDLPLPTMMKAKYYHLRANSLYGTNLVLRALIAWFWSGV